MKHIAIEDLPKEERPYEKFLQFGASALTDTELLAILLQSGTCEASSLELARKVLLVREDISVLALYEKSYEDFLHIKGIGRVKATQLKCIAELSKRIHLAKKPEKNMFLTPKDVALTYMESMRHLDREHLLVAYFNGNGSLILDEVLSIGSVNRTLISPREVFIRALNVHAVYLMLIHNHPSGNATPSQDDIRVTEEIRKAGELLNIPLLDHLIIGDREYVSFKESGYLSSEAWRKA
ncbi:MAG: DNA repair protein RadC [Lachnospiraceae bacterium]|nr:DNA repair protein RadC [Lachnospiraceae bacterium]